MSFQLLCAGMSVAAKNKSRDKEKLGESFYKLVQLIRQLLGPGGCPWDKEQSHQSLKPLLLEEAYEVIESINVENYSALKEELGDLILQIVFHAELARQQGKFDIAEVLKSVCQKLRRRHPHVFGKKQQRLSPEEVLRQWEELKKSEKEKLPAVNSGSESILAGIPGSLPALLRAHRIQDRVARVGFDWEKIADVYKKVKEELKELKHLMDEASVDTRRLEEEFGDLIFALVNLARFLKIHPEEALQRTNEKFIRRFALLEKEAQRQGRQLKSMTLAEMDVLWEKAKCEEDKYIERQR